MKQAMAEMAAGKRLAGASRLLAAVLLPLWLAGCNSLLTAGSPAPVATTLGSAATAQPQPAAKDDGAGAEEHARIVAAVGPCIAQPSYEVGLDFLARFEAEDPASAAFFAPGAGPDKRQFDLPGYVLDRLGRAGVARREWVGHDTCADEALFFSNRRAFKRGEGDYGRLLSAISLRPPGI